jgi:hypothetical protein
VWCRVFRMHLAIRNALLIFTLCAFTATASEAQQPIQLSKQALSVKKKTARLTVGDKISVVLSHAGERYGTFKSSGQEDFTFYDVDQNSDVTLRYGEVKKVKDGYGGYNSVTHRHTDRTRGYIIAGVAAGVLVGLIAAVITAKN